MNILHYCTNTPDGANPRGGFVSSGSFYYGTTVGGGSSGLGTIFRMNPDGTGLTNLHSFGPLATGSGGVFTNADGFDIVEVLVLAGDTLYGNGYLGGTNGTGTLFSFNLGTSTFSNLYTFSATSEGSNNDGNGPDGSLLLVGSTLYGVTMYGGTNKEGALYAIGTNGAGFTNLHSFTGGNGGEGPMGRLAISGNMLYGTTYEGGNDEGIIYGYKPTAWGLPTCATLA